MMQESTLERVVARAILLILLLYTLFPLYTVLSASFKSRSELFQDPFGFPREFHIENYTSAWTVGHMGHSFLVSMILTLGAVLGVVLTGIPAAYALARVKFPGSSVLLSYFFFCTTVPPQLTIIPLYQIFARIGLINSLAGLIVIYIGRWSPFAILLMRSYFTKIPKELVEVAQVDGATTWQAFWRVVFPISRPGIATVVTIAAMWSWNEFLLPLTFLNDKNLQPVTVAVALFNGRWSVQWGRVMAASVMVALPIMVMFVFLHRKFIAGLAGTGLKG